MIPWFLSVEALDNIMEASGDDQERSGNWMKYLMVSREDVSIMGEKG